MHSEKHIGYFCCFFLLPEMYAGTINTFIFMKFELTNIFIFIRGLYKAPENSPVY